MTIACADRGVQWAALFEPPTLSDPYLVPLLTALCQINEIWFAEGGQAPPLYASGVRYLGEGVGEEHWRSIPIVLSLGHADCKSLAAWRVAELRRIGERARCRYSSKRTPTGRLWHIFVVRADGTEEDPSRILGMNDP